MYSSVVSLIETNTKYKELMKKTANTLKLAALIGLVLNGTSPVFATTATTTHAVTITVPSIISLIADQSAFTLTMPDFISGTYSNSQTVVYMVKANNITQAVGAPALTASLGSLFTNTDLKVTVGTYASIGGAAATLTAAAGTGGGSFVTVGTSTTTLATRSGTGKIMRGIIPVIYKAYATSDLPAGSSTQTLTVTLTDV